MEQHERFGSDTRRIEAEFAEIKAGDRRARIEAAFGLVVLLGVLIYSLFS